MIARKQPRDAGVVTPKEKPAPPTRREPSDKERAAIVAAQEGRSSRPARAEYREAPGPDGALRVEARHSDEDGNAALVTETFATRSDDFVGRSLLHLANSTAKGLSPSIGGLNASLAIIAAIAPENELEAALAANMAATHDLSMVMLSRAQSADRPDHMREYANVATKLQRTFTTQMKALSDWRRGGEQVVRHVHVGQGGQAVVAETINVGGRKNEELGDRGHEPCTALLGNHAQWDGLPVPSDEGEAAVLPPRRRPRVRGTAR